MTTQYNQGASLYSNNISTVIQIPSLLVSTSSNSYQNITVPEQNIIKLSTNLATSMTKMSNSNFTKTIDEINQATISSVNAWNSKQSNQNQQLTIQSLLPPLNGTVNYFENGNQVMEFTQYSHLFFSNGSKIIQPNHYYKHVPSFNTNALTYSNSVSNYNPLCLSNLVTNQICINNNIGLSSLNGSQVIDLNNNLKNYTNLGNLIGSYHCLDIESMFNSFAGFGYVKYDLDYNNTTDKIPNVYGGSLIQLISRYNIYVTVPNILPTTSTPTTSTTTSTPTTSTPTSTPTPGIDNYQIQLDVPYIVYFDNLVSQQQLNTNLALNTTSSSNGSSATGLTVPSSAQVNAGVVPISYL
jgi:hypothetical protein